MTPGSDDFSADMAELNDEGGSPTTEPTERGTKTPPDSTTAEPEEVEPEEEESPEEEPEGEEEEEREEEEPVRVHSRPTVKQITSRYPNFFKEFPDMRHMLFREGEYGRLFPTVDDARTAADDAENFKSFSQLVTSGKADDFGEFLNGVKEVKGLPSFAANFLPQLYKTDQGLYFKVTSPIGESLVRNAYAAAVQAGNEDLKNSALHMAQWAFGNVGYATGEKKSPPIEVPTEKKDPQLEQERREFYQTKYNDAQDYVKSTGRQRLTAEIKRGLDPQNAFTPTMQNLLIKEILSEIGLALEADERHMGQMNSLWRGAHKAGFAGEWKDRILSTYLSRARQVMPAIRTKIRDGAMNQEERSASHREETATRSSTRKEIHGSGSSGARSANGRPPAARDVDWSKTSDMDFLSDKVTLKKR